MASKIKISKDKKNCAICHDKCGSPVLSNENDFKIVFSVFGIPCTKPNSISLCTACQYKLKIASDMITLEANCNPNEDTDVCFLCEEETMYLHNVGQYMDKDSFLYKIGRCCGKHPYPIKSRNQKICYKCLYKVDVCFNLKNQLDELDAKEVFSDVVKSKSENLRTFNTNAGIKITKKKAGSASREQRLAIVLSRLSMDITNADSYKPRTSKLRDRDSLKSNDPISEGQMRLSRPKPHSAESKKILSVMDMLNKRKIKVNRNIRKDEKMYNCVCFVKLSSSFSTPKNVTTPKKTTMTLKNKTMRNTRKNSQATVDKSVIVITSDDASSNKSGRRRGKRKEVASPAKQRSKRQMNVSSCSSDDNGTLRFRTRSVDNSKCRNTRMAPVKKGLDSGDKFSSPTSIKRMRNDKSLPSTSVQPSRKRSRTSISESSVEMSSAESLQSSKCKATSSKNSKIARIELSDITKSPLYNQQIECTATNPDDLNTPIPTKDNFIDVLQSSPKQTEAKEDMESENNDGSSLDKFIEPTTITALGPNETETLNPDEAKNSTSTALNLQENDDCCSLSGSENSISLVLQDEGGDTPAQEDFSPIPKTMNTQLRPQEPTENEINVEMENSSLDVDAKQSVTSENAMNEGEETQQVIQTLAEPDNPCHDANSAEADISELSEANQLETVTVESMTTSDEQIEVLPTGTTNANVSQESTNAIELVNDEDSNSAEYIGISAHAPLLCENDEPTNVTEILNPTAQTNGDVNLIDDEHDAENVIHMNVSSDESESLENKTAHLIDEPVEIITLDDVNTIEDMRDSADVGNDDTGLSSIKVVDDTFDIVAETTNLPQSDATQSSDSSPIIVDMLPTNTSIEYEQNIGTEDEQNNVEVGNTYTDVAIVEISVSEENVVTENALELAINTTETKSISGEVKDHCPVEIIDKTLHTSVNEEDSDVGNECMNDAQYNHIAATLAVLDA